jgi:DNA replication protein DnaC
MGELTLAAAILDRLLHKANVLSIKGRSYRLRGPGCPLGTARA